MPAYTIEKELVLADETFLQDTRPTRPPQYSAALVGAHCRDGQWRANVVSGQETVGSITCTPGLSREEALRVVAEWIENSGSASSLRRRVDLQHVDAPDLPQFFYGVVRVDDVV